MIRVTRKGAVTLAVLALASGAPQLALAAPGSVPPPGSVRSAPAVDEPGRPLPEGWRISDADGERELVWTASKPIPIGDSRVEFHAGDVRLGVPVASKDQRTFRLKLGSARIGAGDDLKVLASGRRLDEAGQQAEARRRAAPERRVANPPLAPANPVDPGVKGRYQTTSGEYSLSSVKLPDFPAKVEMKATVVGPKNATGPRPLALFLHGRHSTCYNTAGDSNIDWPCPSGFRQIPSYKGYLHDQKLLASQGYVTVSLSANGINGQDAYVDDAGAQARSSLVRQHLARWAGWAKDPATAPAAVKRLPKADLDKVLLVGHSRGGEGVNRAALDTLHQAPAAADGYRGPVRWKIRGTVLIGPTIFGHNPAPDVPSLTLLPGCDGDVSDLQGQIYADGTRGTSRGKALQAVAYVIGANHNFFNTEWTPGQAVAPAWDDWGGEGNAYCDAGTAARLKATQQQKAGSTYIAAAARLFVAGDDKVRPLLDGSHRSAPSANPARVLTHAVGAHRKPAVLPTTSTKVTGGKVCNQVDHDETKSCLPWDGKGTSPHFAYWHLPRETGRYAVTAAWSRAGTPVKVTPSRPFSVKGSDALALRVIVPPNTTGTKLDVRITDTNGRRARLGQATVDGLPGNSMTSSAWAREVRVPLRSAVRAGLDLTKVKSLELVPRSTKGKLWLMDAWGWRPGTPAPDPAKDMPRVDFGRLVVKEGNSGSRTVRVPVHVSGRGSGQIRLYTDPPGPAPLAPRTVTVKPGTQHLDVPVTVDGNTRYGHDVAHDVFAKAVRGAVVGSDRGGVTVENDDPMPTFTVRPVADRVTEGSPLAWRMTLSAPADSEVYGPELRVLPVTGGTELSTKDVPADWLATHFGVGPDPQRPLSQLDGSNLWLSVPAGRLSADVAVPTVRDTVTEGPESIRLQLTTYDEEGMPTAGSVLTGTVTDAP